MFKEPLNNSDIEKLAELLTRSKKPEILGRALLCKRIGIDPKTIGFIRQADDYSFALELINHLNDIDDQEALCKLGNEIYFTFSKGRFGPELATILTKLNCNPELRENNLSNQPVEQPIFSSESSPNFPHQPYRYRSRPQSWLSIAGNVKNRLIIGGATLLIVIGLSGFYYSQHRIKFDPEYSRLENALNHEDFQDADKLTYKLIWGVAKDIAEIKCQDLENIDKLWRKNSGNRFGFTVQSKLWKQSNKDLIKFLKDIGWVHQDGAIYLIPKDFSREAPQGQFPWELIYYSSEAKADGLKARSDYLNKLISCFP